MAKRKRYSIRVEGLDYLMAKLERLNGDSKKIAEECLNAGHKIITPKAIEASQKANLPAKGRYSTGRTKRSTKLNESVEWKGNVGKEDVGYSISEGGLAWIFMMWGTPRHMKNKKMWSAFYGAKTKREVSEAQKKIFFDEYRRLMGL